ncbi:MAG: hypothetical protein A2015_00100 [Spirochaetes bacterium GWF1_31_7]|nr:MAG: hypothetical protein A2Y30_00275 [Spirochaetes bacterium GWE1_32_154]OHD50988.1 MAG: hypothetical protein A2Y29_10600 [Spirochaetes bacterium GWE2_31_10]OHD51642.1 MAG: hypothetical protein A2015_00100 [Spirochaetes bacterium GWF1_31_7]HBD94988.1 hypothetical protein [Spirochaetia bacterium]HBI36704.1 hypothetical protein [Spirochaetia bacterium]
MRKILFSFLLMFLISLRISSLDKIMEDELMRKYYLNYSYKQDILSEEDDNDIRIYSTSIEIENLYFSVTGQQKDFSEIELLDLQENDYIHIKYLFQKYKEYIKKSIFLEKKRKKLNVELEKIFIEIEKINKDNKLVKEWSNEKKDDPITLEEAKEKDPKNFFKLIK